MVDWARQLGSTQIHWNWTAEIATHKYPTPHGFESHGNEGAIVVVVVGATVVVAVGTVCCVVEIAVGIVCWQLWSRQIHW